MNTITANVLVLLGWGVTVALVYFMLSGPFNGGMCETTCFTMLYFAALVLAVVGTILSLVQAINPDTSFISTISFSTK